MAKMWPRKLPRVVRLNPLRAAECEVFSRLEEALSDEWTVFYSRPWLGLSPSGEEVDGEADFAIIHPEHGLLTLEVKGGSIVYDPTKDSWSSKDRHQITWSIKDPVNQARSAKHNLLRLLNESPSWRPHFIRARHGVVFPHTSMSSADLGVDRPRRIFADKKQVNTTLAEWVHARFQHREENVTDRSLAPGGACVQALESILAAPFHLRVPLGHYLDDDDQGIEVLTAQQFHLISAISQIHRLAIRGAAGTGKTVLATEAAKRAALSGRRVLLTCYNSALAAVLSRKFDGDVEVQTFHSLCRSIAAKASIAIPKGVTEQDLYENVLPTLLADAAQALPSERYDTIIVDEGQDIRPHWWPAVDSLLAPDGRLVIFYDDNQRFYGDAKSLPRDVSASPVVLNQNLRNTLNIHEVVMRHYQGMPVVGNDIPGQKPLGVPCENEAAVPRRCRQALARLVGPEKVAPSDIAILVAREGDIRRLAPDGSISGTPVVRADSPNKNAVVLDTVRRFKGLDARLVIILATPAMIADSDLAYVATSRARTHLVGVGEKSELTALGIT